MIKQTLDLSGVTPLNRTQIEHVVHTAGEFASRIIFEHRSRTINGKSMLGIRATVRLVAPKSIERSEGKAKRVIDKRNLYV